ncbi:hypothetical protein B0H10DRAFT_1938641 [Mycena sp. CBHHK59/15]|nr:hypothetical protein B0H10DRAFT_1938641 [Mycena sp. CBHHK59/15]
MASGTTKPAINPRSIASDIPLDKLKISAKQCAALDHMYQLSATASTDQVPVNHLFKLDDDDQLYAAAIMAQHGLDLDAREHLSNRWSQQWSRHSGKSPNNADNMWKLLYLCDCGYDHCCLAHTEITYAVGSQKILHIRGYFKHNQGCKDTVFTHIPPIPIHPSVFTVTLAQLRDGATFMDVKKKNRELFAARHYKGFPADLNASPYRWLIETHDSRSLYCQYNCLNSVKVTEKPQIKIDEWLDPASPQYNTTISEAIFHDSAWASEGEHFEACVATEEMRETGKYGHKSQIILDRTFGVCDSRLLLFILMVVNENKMGIHFSSSSGYNTSIIAKLIQAWKNSLTKCGHLYGFEGVVFNPFTAITDMDLKERGALLIDIVEARSLLAAETNTLHGLGNSKPIHRALKHIKYLSEYWTTGNLWKSWSDYGRKVAAALDATWMVVLKHKHVQRWQNGGRWLCVDVLIRILVIHILPSIFQERHLYCEQCLRLAAQIRRLPGGHSLLQHQSSGHHQPAIPSVVYLAPDQQCYERAVTIVNQRQIGSPTLLPDNTSLTFTCYSSEALEVESDPVQYTIMILFNGVATCKCTDFYLLGSDESCHNDTGPESTDEDDSDADHDNVATDKSSDSEDGDDDDEPEPMPSHGGSRSSLFGKNTPLHTAFYPLCCSTQQDTAKINSSFEAEGALAATIPREDFYKILLIFFGNFIELLPHTLSTFTNDGQWQALETDGDVPSHEAISRLTRQVYVWAVFPLFTPEDGGLPDGVYIATGLSGHHRLMISDSTVWDVDAGESYITDELVINFPVQLGVGDEFEYGFLDRHRLPLTNEQEDRREEIKYSNAKTTLRLKQVI